MGSAAPDTQRDLDPLTDRRDVASYVSADPTRRRAPEPQPQARIASRTAQPATPSALRRSEHLQYAVLQTLTDGNQRILVSMLSAGEWSVQATNC